MASLADLSTTFFEWAAKKPAKKDAINLMIKAEAQYVRSAGDTASEEGRRLAMQHALSSAGLNTGQSPGGLAGFMGQMALIAKWTVGAGHSAVNKFAPTNGLRLAGHVALGLIEFYIALNLWQNYVFPAFQGEMTNLTLPAMTLPKTDTYPLSPWTQRDRAMTLKLMHATAADGGSCDINLTPLPFKTARTATIDRPDEKQPPCVAPDPRISLAPAP